MQKLFVYGSLLRNFGNHLAQLGRFEPRLLGDASTSKEFHLLDFGPCPAMVHGGKTPVAGEVYEVTEETLAHLDKFESCPRLYRRELINLVGGTQAWAYVMPAQRAALRQSRPVISGDWTQRPPWIPPSKKPY